MAAELTEITIAAAGRAFRSGDLSPVELTDAYLARIEALDGDLHAYLEVTSERARAEARTAEAELRAGDDRGPLHGIPYGLKDIYETAGLRTTAHSKLLEHHVPSADCTVQQKLHAGGGVLLGKQATWEFAYGGPSFDLPWPPARNPWDLSRSTLGSSSGAGASIAAGMCAGAMGSDTGGSIRMPAAVCGIAGHKPTYGLVSRKGVLPNSYTFDHCGPMAWTAEDCALMMQVIAGFDPGDPGSLDVPVPDFVGALDAPLSGLRIGWVRHWYEEEVNATPAVVAAMQTSVAALRELGCTVTEVTLPSLRDFTDCKTPITLAEIYAIHEHDLKTRPNDFGRSLRWRITPGALVRAEDYVQAMRWRTELTARTLAIFDEVDLLVTAGGFSEAPPLAEEDPPTFLGAAVPSITTPYNLTGMPALSVCNGFGDGGLPLAIQIAGAPLDDARVLALGVALERITDFRSHRPAIAKQ
jgi:aspartyl-tRNA(Asn)/glutamyl-tRNA(Gln) amidotransferase subunit A